MATAPRSQNELFFGDNLAILREHIDDESVDLVYLDPPFKSEATYNVLFRSPKGHDSHAQIKAFEDTWHWGEQASAEFEDLVQQANTDLSERIQALKKCLGENDMMAYLTMMTTRLIELRRVLKPTGSLYLHCDPTASHYLKLVLDGIFGADNFRNEVVWKRTNARATDARWPRVHDVIFFYSASDQFTFHALKVKADKAKLPHTLITGADGKKYQTYELTAPGATKEGASGRPWRGQDPNKYGRHWGNSPAQMDAWDSAGLIHWPKDGGFPRRRAKDVFDPESRLVMVGDVWTDIDRINQTAAERLGYPTQKPVSLLERIIAASSNEDDVVLDPFCGCGTAIDAAQRLRRRWIGIDITNLAISIVESRLRRYFPSVTFALHGTPKDLDGARALAERDPYEFQYWACGLVDAQPYQQRKKGADRGIDGIKYFVDDANETCKIVVSVKGGQNISSHMVRDLRGVIDREKAKIGLFITLKEPTAAMEREAIEAGFYNTSRERFPRIQILTIDALLAGAQPARHPGASLGRHKIMRPAKRRGKGDEGGRQRELFADTAGRVAGEVHKLSETVAGRPKRPGVEAPSAEQEAADLGTARQEAAIARPARAAARSRRVGGR